MEYSTGSRTNLRNLFVGVVLAGVLGTAQAQRGADGVVTGSITAEGHATQAVAAQTIRLSLEVRVKDRSPLGAERKLARAVTSVFTALAAGGVDIERDVRTHGLGLHPDRGEYVAQKTVEVTRPFTDDVTAFLETALGAGATGFGGLQFDVSAETVESESVAVLKRAVGKARRHAEAVAGAEGMQVGRLLHSSIAYVNVGSTQGPGMRKGVLSSASADSIPVSGGQGVTISAGVQATFEMSGQ